jgi:phage gpG-like protein
MPDLVKPALMKGMKQGMLLVERTARSPYLSGKALQRRTGRLRNSITTDVQIDGDRVIGRIGTAVVYGRIHELGYSGPIGVRAHSRTIRQAFGRAISPVTVDVRAHTRQADIPARPFLRPAIEDNLTDIQRILVNRIEEAFEGV